MKKSKINEKDIINDTNKMLNFIDDLDNIDIEKVDIEKLEKDIKTFENELTKKYKDILPKEDLDSKE
tara:strand:- start:278 stop:478 length:201 start_codon:yes stop_codon:yes gene_type:complete